MSDLQMSLLVIGAVVVVGVYLFNWFQERRFRRKFAQAFGAGHDDVLLKTASGAGDRIEPQLQSAAAPDEAGLPEAAAQPEAEAAPDLPSAPGFDTVIDYVAAIDADEPVADAALSELLTRIVACGKPCRCVGFDAAAGEWKDLGRSTDGRYAQLRFALQLVNRAGPVNPAQLAVFRDAVKKCADAAGAQTVCLDPQAALKAAHDLDEFCAEVDVAIGVNIVAAGEAAFSGTGIRTLAETAGFALEPDGIFRFRDGQRRTLFTLDNHEPAPFLPEQIKSLSTRGVTLLLDVPRATGGPEVLDRMLEIAGSFAQALGGRLVDDNRVPLNEPGIAKIRQQLAAIHAAMEERGVSAGGARALRLFS